MLLVVDSVEVVDAVELELLDVETVDVVVVQAFGYAVGQPS